MELDAAPATERARRKVRPARQSTGERGGRCPDCRRRVFCPRCNTVLAHINLAINIAKEMRYQPARVHDDNQAERASVSTCADPYERERKRVAENRAKSPLSARLNDDRIVFLSPQTGDLVQIILETMLRVWPRYDPERGIIFGAFCRKAVKGEATYEVERQIGIARGGSDDASLNAPTGTDDDGGPVTLGDSLSADGMIVGDADAYRVAQEVEDKVFYHVDHAADAAKWRAAVDKLTEPERAILQYRLQGGTGKKSRPNSVYRREPCPIGSAR